VLTQPLPDTMGSAAQSVVVQPDGKILVAGSGSVVSRHSDIVSGAIVRLDSNGSLDTTFGDDGVVTGDGLQGILTLGLDSAGDIFVLPEFEELKPTGAADGKVTTEPIVASSHGGDDAFESDGRAVTGETVAVGKHVTDVEVQRFSPGGTADSSFSSTPFPYSSVAAQDSATALAIAPSGDIAVGGSQFHDNGVLGLALLGPTGALDDGFGTDGTLTTDINGDEGISGLAVQSNGDIVATGFTEVNSSGVVKLFVARYIG